MLSYNVAKNRITPVLTMPVTDAIKKNAIQGILGQVSEDDREKLIDELDLYNILNLSIKVDENANVIEDSEEEEAPPESPKNDATVDASMTDGEKWRAFKQLLKELLS